MVFNISRSGTSFAAPMVAGAAAVIQSANGSLKIWPEACRAILLASAGRNIAGSTWFNDVRSHVDSTDGAGALDVQIATSIALQHVSPNSAAVMRGWNAAILSSSSFGADSTSLFQYNMFVPGPTNRRVRVVLAWSSVVSSPTGTSTLTCDLDVWVRDPAGTLVSFSSSLDNSYEVVDFTSPPNKTYNFVIRRPSGNANGVRYAVAWTIL